MNISKQNVIEFAACTTASLAFFGGIVYLGYLGASAPASKGQIIVAATTMPIMSLVTGTLGAMACEGSRFDRRRDLDQLLGQVRQELNERDEALQIQPPPPMFDTNVQA